MWRLYLGDSHYMDALEDNSINLVVTSPYPMVSMWTEMFAATGCETFDEMHEYLNGVWRECYRVLGDGGIMCINIGDAANAYDGGIYRLYDNHSRVMCACEQIGFYPLPYILWRKHFVQNRNPFLGSGFLPPNAYVSLDHEFILLFRKGEMRAFAPHDPIRYASQYSYMERNEWFSATWTFLGAKQTHSGMRIGCFPLELPKRIIRMYSIEGDAVLDPFAGKGTTLRAAITAKRDAIGYEINPRVFALAKQEMSQTIIAFEAT